MTNKKDTKKDLIPVRPAEFQTSQHRFTRFDCTVQGDFKEIKELENPALWTNVAGRLKMFDEIRVIPDDYSFVAYLLVTFVQGSSVRVKVVGGAELESTEDLESSTALYDVKQAGPKKWIIYNTNTAEEVKTHIPTKAEAYKQLEEHVAAMNR